MVSNNKEVDRINREYEFLDKLKTNEITIPNIFTREMGKIIKLAREEAGLSQSELAEKLFRRQATISDFENGKIEIGILTLVQIAKVFGKPISYFIPQMSFMVSISDIQSKYEEEALALFRDIESWGDFQLALRFLKMLRDYCIEERDREMGNEDEEEN